MTRLRETGWHILAECAALPFVPHHHWLADSRGDRPIFIPGGGGWPVFNVKRAQANRMFLPSLTLQCLFPRGTASRASYSGRSLAHKRGSDNATAVS